MPLLRSRTRLSKVNTKRLLDDVADSYRHSIEETIVVEAIANALDAGSARIAFSTDVKSGSLQVLDDGSGMSEEEFDVYHDLAQSSKVRGAGIGFAGLGAKLAHKLSSKILTDTRSDSFAAGSDWWWQGDDLRFKTRRCRIKKNGTRVEYLLEARSSRLLDPGWLEETIVEHFTPLLEQELASFYVWNSTYPRGVQFTINGRTLNTRPLVMTTESVGYLDVKPARGKRAIGKAVFVLSGKKLPEHLQGVALTTHGKVISRSGLSLSPADGDRITGCIEIPDLVGCLTLNKQDFIAHGSMGHKFRRLRDQAKLAYSEWLRDIGRNVDKREARNTPRRLESELAQLTRLVPEIDFLFGHRESTKISVRSPSGDDNAVEAQGSLLTGGTSGTSGSNAGASGNGQIPEDVGPSDGTTLSISDAGPIPVRQRRRTSRRGPRVQLVREPERTDMSWIDMETVMINTAHLAYTKAQREGQVRYHQRAAALIALCEAASENIGLDLLKRALSNWGRH